MKLYFKRPFCDILLDNTEYRGALWKIIKLKK